eukprot:1296849-Amphidinium_carterae.1
MGEASALLVSHVCQSCHFQPLHASVTSDSACYVFATTLLLCQLLIAVTCDIGVNLVRGLQYSQRPQQS